MELGGEWRKGAVRVHGKRRRRRLSLPDWAGEPAAGHDLILATAVGVAAAAAAAEQPAAEQPTRKGLDEPIRRLAPPWQPQAAVKQGAQCHATSTLLAVSQEGKVSLIGTGGLRAQMAEQCNLAALVVS